MMSNQSDSYPELQYTPRTQNSNLSHWRSAIKNTELVLALVALKGIFRLLNII